MDYKVVWTDPAIENLQSIFDHLADDQPQNARGVVTKIIERVETLETYPAVGDLFRKRAKVRQIFSDVYRIFYRVLEDQRRVEILAVWHGSRRNPKLPLDTRLGRIESAVFCKKTLECGGKSLAGKKCPFWPFDSRHRLEIVA